MENEQKIKSSVQAISESACCGCAACEAICPVRAIAMVLDESGFYYPRVGPEKCIYCGKCMQVCAFSRELPKQSL